VCRVRVTCPHEYPHAAADRWAITLLVVRVASVAAGLGDLSKVSRVAPQGVCNGCVRAEAIGRQLKLRPQE